MAGLQINEIFHSIQGESTRAGMPCIFIRLRGCHLRCSYCDTSYAFNEGNAMEVDAILEHIASWSTPLVQITGGEPLLQQDVHVLMRRLADAGRTVLLETSGACDISPCDARVIRIVDFKTPGSGEVDRNDWGNVEHLHTTDEVKFVLCDRADYDWAAARIAEHGLVFKAGCVLFSPVHVQRGDAYIAGAEGLDPDALASWILEDGLPVRMQLQMHKFIWGPATRGV